MAANKRAGKKSLAQNDYLAPAAPLITTATDVGTSRAFNNGAVTIAFTAQGPNAATSFTVTSSPGAFTATGSSSPLTVEGLQSDTAYTFTATATNAAGTSPASAASASVTATTVPATPSAPTATSPSAGVDRVTWTAPANGGKAITGYTWASNDSKTGTTASTTVDVTQEQGTAQTYTVFATNANGNSGTSAASNSITTTFSFAPFGAFGFSPFGFSPFGAFGFSPFGFAPIRGPK
jgi:trimeric autotransporter adhesin